MFINPQHEQAYREFQQKIQPLRQRKEVDLQSSLHVFTMNNTVYQKLLAFAYAFTGVEKFMMQAKRDKKLFQIHVRNIYKPPLEFNHLRMNFKQMTLQEISLLDLIMYFLRQSTTIDTALAYPFPLYRLAYLGEREFTLFANAWRLAAGHHDLNPFPLKMYLKDRNTQMWDKSFAEITEELINTKENLEQQIREKKAYKDGILTRPHKNYQIALDPDKVQRILHAATYLRYQQTDNLNQWANYLVKQFPFILDYELLLKDQSVLNAGIASFNEIPKLLMNLTETEYPLVMQALVHVFQIPIEEDVEVVDISNTGA